MNKKITENSPKVRPILVCRLCHSEYTDFQKHVKSLVHLDARIKPNQTSKPTMDPTLKTEPPDNESPAKKLKTDVGDSSNINSKNGQPSVCDTSKDEGAASSSVSVSEKINEAASKATPEESANSSDKNPFANGISSEKSDKNEKSEPKGRQNKQIGRFLEKHWHCALCVHVHRMEDESFDEHALQEDHKMSTEARLEHVTRDWNWRKKRRWIYHCSACQFHTNDKESYISHVKTEPHDENVKKVMESIVKAQQAFEEGKASTPGPSKTGENKNTDTGKSKAGDNKNTAVGIPKAGENKNTTPAKAVEPAKAPASAGKPTTDITGPRKSIEPVKAPTSGGKSPTNTTGPPRPNVNLVPSPASHSYRPMQSYGVSANRSFDPLHHVPGVGKRTSHVRGKRGGQKKKLAVLNALKRETELQISNLTVKPTKQYPGFIQNEGGQGKPGGFNQNEGGPGKPGGFNQNEGRQGKPGGFGQNEGGLGKPGGFNQNEGRQGKPGGFNQNEGSQGKPGRPLVSYGPKQQSPGNPQGIHGKFTSPSRDRFIQDDFQNRSGNFSSQRNSQLPMSGGRSMFPEDQRDLVRPSDRSNRFGMDPPRNYEEVWSRNRPGNSLGDSVRNSSSFSGIDANSSTRHFSDISSRSGVSAPLEPTSSSSFRNDSARIEQNARLIAMMLDGPNRMEFSRMETSRMEPSLSRIDSSRMELSLSRMDTSRMEPSRMEMSRMGSARMESPWMDSSMLEMRREPSRMDLLKMELSRMDEPRQHQSRMDSSRDDQSRIDQSRTDLIRREMSRIDIPLFSRR